MTGQVVTLNGGVLHDFDRYVRDPAVRHAEELLSADLAAQFGAGDVADARDMRGVYDFRATVTYDAKICKYIHSQGRVVYEDVTIYPDGHAQPGWGRSRQLDVVVFVNHVTWEGHWLALAPWRAYIEDWLRVRAQPPGWLHTASRNNRGQVTHCWAITLEELRQVDGVVLREGPFAGAAPPLDREAG